jgi:tetratricopeptide (TPR) repeat protein
LTNTANFPAKNGGVAVPAPITVPRPRSRSVSPLEHANSGPQATGCAAVAGEQAGIRRVRVFVSSPGDANHERGRVHRVVERLNGEFSGTARLETIRWENEFYRAHATFQAQIPEAAECDIVIAVFRHRIGTELPSTFARLLDGSPYPSGTAYEVLSAIEACRCQGHPDVYVFRHPDPPMVRLDDPEAEQTQEQWQRLKQFFDTWFQAADGGFKAAFQTFATIDDFEAQLDRLLRGWLEDKVLHGRAVLWPTEVKGSPFRGLAAFGAKHAPVFFGRSRDITRAVDQWKGAAERGSPFLLLVGASGAGKSSLARAGLVPRITAPGVVPTVDLWRVAVMHPSEASGGPNMSLATRLFDAEQNIPEEERGRPPALPEIAEGDYHTPTELEHLFAEAASAASVPVIGALDRAAVAERARHGYQRDLRGGLVIVIDQLDELFGPEVTPEERSTFARLLTVFAETGRVWLLATLRADLYERFLAEPALMALKTSGAAYDLSPPGPAELAEIVRKPAEAAELVFEADPKTGERLDERLLREADRPDMLPLLQLALNRLFEGRVAGGDGATLTIAAYESLGGLAGVVDREAERAISGLAESEIALLPQLLRRLAAISRYDGAEAGARPGSLTIRTVPLAEAAPDGPSRRLVQALVEARILLTSGEGAAAGIRLAHQRVLTDWTRARELVAANTEFYRIREEVEDQRRRWQIARKSHDLLIPYGLPLAEAELIAKRFGDELPAVTLEFVRASGRRARMRQRLTTAAAVLFAVLALAATGAGIFAWRQEQRAEQSLDAAEKAADVIVADVAHGLRDIEGIRVSLIRTVLEKMQMTVEWLTGFAPDNVALWRLYLEMLDEFAATYETAGDIARARESAMKALTKGRELADRYRDDANWQRDISVTLNRLGSVALSSGEVTEALKNYEEALAIMRRLAEPTRNNVIWQQDLASSLHGIGNVKSRTGDARGALAAYDEGLVILRRLAQSHPDDLGLQREIAVRANDIGDMKLRTGDTTAAAADYEEGLTIARDLVKKNPGNTRWQRDVFFSLTKLGDLKVQMGEATAAVALYGEAVANARHLAARDPDNSSFRFDIAQALCKLGDVVLGDADQDARVAHYEQALEIIRGLVQRDARNTGWQWALSVSLNKIGDVKLLRGDADGAYAAYAEGLTIVGHLAEIDPENLALVRDVALSLTRVGDIRLRTGDLNGAAANYEQALANVRRLSERDPSNTLWLKDMVVTLNKLGDAKLRTGDIGVAGASYDEALATVRRLVDCDPSNGLWQWDLWFTLKGLGDATLSLGDKAAARGFYAEGLTIIRRITEAEPGNAQRQTDLVVTLYRVASAEDVEGPQRERALQEAFAILGRLQAEGKLTPEKSGWPDSIREMLAFP